MAELTQARLKELTSYDPETGQWSGEITIYNYKKPSGYQYRKVLVDGKSYHSGRLAWFYMTGKWPELEVDHEDKDGWNDRWTNLREATRAQQLVNRGKWGKSGLPKGVHKYGNKYKAACGWQGKEIHLGYFPTPEEASEAYQVKVKELHGSFISI